MPVERTNQNESVILSRLDGNTVRGGFENNRAKCGFRIALVRSMFHISSVIDALNLQHHGRKRIHDLDDRAFDALY